MIRLADIVEVDGAGRPVLPRADKVPTWAGSYSFGPFVQSSRGLATFETSSAMHLGAVALTLAQRARVICFDAETVAALPDWESDRQLWDFCDELSLPADPCFLDFVTPTSGAPRVQRVALEDDNTLDYYLTGALIWRGQQDEVVVIPHLTFHNPTTDGPMAIQLGAHRFVTHMISAAVTFGHLDRRRYGARGDWREMREYGDISGWAVRYGPVFSEELDERDQRGVGLWAIEDEWHYTDEIAGPWSLDSVMVRAAALALAALTLLEVEQAQLEATPLTRAETKRAAKRGWPVADLVRFRRTSRAASGNAESSSARAWTHRWLVIGHTRHHPAGSRLGDIDHGRHLKPCTRLACAGMCRRIRVKSHIKGPDHLPLKPKTLMVSQKADTVAA